MCAKAGRYHTFNASASGGEIVTGGCRSKGASTSASVPEVTDKEITDISPKGKVTKGSIINVEVSYDFKYDNADTCTGNIPNRQVSVDYAGVQSNLPARGTASFPFNLGNSTGFVMITARACCNGDCRPYNHLVYVEPEDDKCLDVGKPVNVASGNVAASQTDFILLGIMPINFTRYYNSKSAQIGGFNYKWSHTFETKATAWGNAYKIINADDPADYYMDNDGDKIYLPEYPKGIKSRVVKKPDGTVARELYDGTKEEFNLQGYLTAVVDMNGNRITLSRDAYNKLTAITDPAGRVITVTYDAYNRINQITLPDGKIISYTYASYLQKVTYPDGTYRIYEYSGYNLTGIKNENGNYIEKHTYDAQGRGITSSADGTNEKLTISYM